MPDFLKSLGLNKAECEAAATTVVNRLVDPVTENFLRGTWLPGSAIPDLLGEDVLKGSRNRFYGIRRTKELAMVSTAEKRFLQQLNAVKERIQNGRLKDPIKIQRAIGRIKAKNSRVADFYQITFVEKTSTIKDKGTEKIREWGSYNSMATR